jgi:hypothetical protein
MGVPTSAATPLMAKTIPILVPTFCRSGVNDATATATMEWMLEAKKPTKMART